MLMLKIGIISIIRAIFTCANRGNECVLDVYERFWKFLEVSQSCNMLQLGVERCSVVSPVCRYALTIISAEDFTQMY